MLYDAIIAPFFEFEFMRRALVGTFALALGAAPIGLFLMMLHMKPDYVSLLWTDPMGMKMSAGAIILMLIGSYAIKKIVDIKV